MQSIPKMPRGRQTSRQRPHHAYCHHCKCDFSVQYWAEDDRNEYRRGSFVRSKVHGKIPLILHCGHSVCEMCAAKDMKNGTIVCVQCKHASSVADDMLTDVRKLLPINYYYVGMLLFNTTVYQDSIEFQRPGWSVNMRKPQNSTTKDVCVECRFTLAKSHCRECKMSFCNKCFGVVHKLACFSHHRPVPVEQYVAALPDYMIVPPCEKHNDKVQFYCVNCENMYCGPCVLMSHRDHSIQDLVDKNRESMNEFMTLSVQMKHVYERLKCTKKQIDAELASLPRRKSGGTADNCITSHFNEFHGRLQVVENRLRRELDERRGAAENNLTELAADVEQSVADIERIFEVPALLEDEKLASTINMTRVVAKLKELLDTKCHLFGGGDHDIDLTELIIDDDFLSMIDSHCSLLFPTFKKYTLLGSEDLPEDYEVASVTSADLSVTSLSFPLSERSFSRSRAVTPKPDRPGSVSPAAKSDRFAAGAYVPVLVTHISNPNSFYIQHCDDSRVLLNMEEGLRVYARNVKPPNKVEINNMYLVRFKDNKWYRVVVKSIDRDEKKNANVYTVSYVDYGNEQSTTIGKLRPIVDEFATHPPMARKCSLCDVIPFDGKWSSDAVRMMAKMLDSTSTRRFVGDEISETILGVKANAAIIDVGDDDELHVDLITNPDDGLDMSTSVRDALVFLYYARFVTNNGAGKRRCKFNEERETRVIHRRDFKKREELEAVVSHVNSPSSFYIQAVAFFEYFQKLSDNLQDRYEKTVNKGVLYTPKQGMLCAVSFDSKWHRGRIVGLPGKKQLEVHLVDYGNIVVVDWTAVRKLYDEFLQFESQAVHCCLSDVTPAATSNVWSTESIVFFMDNVLDKQLQVVVDKPGDPIEITLFECVDDVDTNVNGLLVSKKFATSTGERSKYAKSKLLEVEQTPSYALVEKSRPEKKPAASRVPYRVPVKVLSVTSPSCIYVSIVSLRNVVAEMQQELNEFYDKSKPDASTKWNVNDRCAARSEIDDLWYRGIVCEIDDDRAKIFIKDYARVETIEQNRLRPLEERFFRVRDGAIKCHMSGVKAAAGSQWPMLACERLKELLETYTEVYITKRGPLKERSLPVDIWVEHRIPGGPLDPMRTEFKCLNRTLIDEGIVLPVKEDDACAKTETAIEVYDDDENDTSGTIDEWLSLKETGGMFAIEEWPRASIEKDEFDAIVTHVDRELNVFLHDVAARKAIDAIGSLIKYRFENSKPRSEDMFWQKGQLCIATHDNQYYRARVVDIVDAGVTVHLVDFGNRIVCSPFDLRKTIVLEDEPIRAIPCRLFGVEPVDDEDRTDRVTEAFAGIVTVTVRERSYGTLVVSAVDDAGNDIARFLVEAELAKQTADLPENVGRKKRKARDVTTDAETDAVDDDILDDTDESVVIEQVDDGYRSYPLPAVPEVDATVVSLSNDDCLSWYVQIVDETNKARYAEFLEMLQNEASAQTPITDPQVGQPCVAKFKDDGQWYRGEIFPPIFSNRNDLFVLFVDYGNIDSVTRADVREMKPEWRDLPMQCLRCKLWNVGKPDGANGDDIAEALSDLLLNTSCRMRIRSRRPLRAELYDVKTGKLAYHSLIDKDVIRLLK